MEYKLNRQQELNSMILRKLKNYIYLIEKENNKTKKFSNSQMVERIRKVIERAVEDDN